MISSVEILSKAFLALKEGGQKIVLSVNLYNRLRVCLTLNHPFLMSELKMNIKIIEFQEHFEAFFDLFSRNERCINQSDTNVQLAVVQNQPARTENVQAFAATDVFIKTVDLRRDGSSMQSLSCIEATRELSTASFFQFAKVLGSIKTGFSPGISLEDYHKGSFKNCVNIVLTILDHLLL